MTLKKQVEKILQEYPESRNSDIMLTIEIWRRYFPEKLLSSNGKTYIELESLYDLPREDNVKRIRAKFNSEGKYWPTNAEVAKGRGILEDVWRQQMGYPKLQETKNPTKQESYTEKVGVKTLF